MRATLMILLIACTTCGLLEAQERAWGVTPEIGLSRFSGTAVKDSAGESRSFHPSSSTSVGIRVDRTGRNIGFAVGVFYDVTGMVETGEPIALTIHDIVKLYSVRPAVSVRIFNAGPSAVFITCGLALERWQLAGEDARHRLGGQGAIGVRAPLGGQFFLQVRWEASLSPSILENQELPDDFKLRGNLQTKLGIGIRLGL